MPRLNIRDGKLIRTAAGAAGLVAEGGCCCGCNCRCPDGTLMPEECCQDGAPDTCRCDVNNGPCCSGSGHVGFMGSGATMFVSMSLDATVVNDSNAACPPGTVLSTGSYVASGFVGAPSGMSNGCFRRVLFSGSNVVPVTGGGTCNPPCGSGTIAAFTAGGGADATFTSSGGYTFGFNLGFNATGFNCRVPPMGIQASASFNCATGAVSGPPPSGSPGLNVSNTFTTSISATSLSVTMVSVGAAVGYDIFATTVVTVAIIGASFCDSGAACGGEFPQCVESLTLGSRELYVPRRLISLPTPAEVAAVSRGGPLLGCGGCLDERLRRT